MRSEEVSTAARKALGEIRSDADGHGDVTAVVVNVTTKDSSEIVSVRLRERLKF